MQGITTRRSRRTTGLALVVAAGALVAMPAIGHAAQFGADLRNNDNTVIQPSNAGNDSCHTADHNLGSGPCTRVGTVWLSGAINGNTTAPKDGTIKKIKLVAAHPGTMKPVVAKIKDHSPGSGHGKGKVTAKGGTIDYVSSVAGIHYNIQTFDTHINVTKGEFIGIESSKTSMLRCDQGADFQLLFQPPLAISAPFEKSAGVDGSCELLIQAVIK